MIQQSDRWTGRKMIVKTHSRQKDARMPYPLWVFPRTEFMVNLTAPALISAGYPWLVLAAGKTDAIAE